MDKIQTLGEVLSMLRRRFLLWACVIALGVLVSLAYALSLPREYETSATIQIEQPSIRTGESSIGSINVAMLQKLQIVEQRVMARDNLLTIIHKFSLFPGLTNAQKVELLRRSSRVNHITNPDFRWRQDVSPSALLVTVRMSDPVLAANVANELVNNVLQEEEGRRSVRVRETLEFFDGEERRIGAAIADLEQQIADFKQGNDVLLPGGLDALQTRLASLQQLQLEVERQIVTQTDIGSGSQNSVRAQRARRLEEERRVIQSEIERIAARIRALPGLEQQLSKLERQLGKLEDQYKAITVGKAEAEMNQMLEANRQANSFAVLEKALPPDWPIAPSRKKILAMGGLLSGIVALALVFLAELRNPVIWTRSQFERQLGMRAVAAIPVIETPRARRRRFVRAGLKLGAFSATFAAFAGLILKFGR